MRHIRGSRGTSVIEVLVVMVILLVGILTVVRLFPGGFLSVRRAESMTMAGRLSQQEMERWENNASNLPDGILPVIETIVGGKPVVDIDSNQCLVPDVTDSNALCMRKVVNETTRIPFGGWSNGPEAGSMYTLAYGPIDVEVETGTNMVINDNAHPGREFAVRGGALSRRMIQMTASDPPPSGYLSPFQYAMDYTANDGVNAAIAFPVAPQDRQYWVSLSWWEQPAAAGSTPVYRTALDIPILVPANSTQWFVIGPGPSGGSGVNIGLPVTMGATFLGVEEYSEVVNRGFRQIPLDSTPWSNDPYEYRLLDPILGVISFNPIGYAQKEFGRPLEAKISYLIRDLQIIRDDRRIPNTAPFRVNLSLNRILKVGDSMPDATPYPGISRPRWTGDNLFISADLVAIDLETGWPVDLAASKATVDYQGGTVTFGLTASDSNLSLVGGTLVPGRNRNLRFFYKADGDWSLQFHKAYSQYTRKDNSDLSYGEYSVQNNRLWFSGCNAGNTISVTYDYELTDSAGVKTTHKVIGECCGATDVLQACPYGFTDPSGKVKQWTYIDPKPAGMTSPSFTVTRIYAVNGTSARARVLWRDSDRWRHVDVDTTVLRRPLTQ